MKKRTDKLLRFLLTAALLGLPINSVSAFEVETENAGSEKEKSAVAGEKKNDSERSVNRKVVVTGTKSKKLMKESPVKTEVLDRERMDGKGASNLFDALNGETGLLSDNQCQNCGANTISINGLEGNYTQILFNGVPAVSSLAGVYFAQQYPSELIERVEIVRGGGSALYGSGAIGGVVNVITKKPITDSANIAYKHEFIQGTEAFAHTASGFASAVSKDAKAGIAVYGSKTGKEDWDANSDGYSDLPRITARTFGASGFFNFGSGMELAYNFYTLHEFRSGGNNLDLEPFQSNIREEIDTNRDAGDFRFEHSVSEQFNYTVFGSFALSHRHTYYGPKEDPADPANLADNVTLFGRTENPFMMSGVTANYSPLKNHTLTAGYEFSHDSIKDTNPGLGRTIDVGYGNHGALFQYDWMMDSLNLIAGIRGDKHSEIDHVIASPRFAAIYKATEDLRFRGSVASGFKAPQVFDEDFHIEVSLADGTGSQKVIENDPNLKEERSLSYAGDMTADFHYKKLFFDVTLGGFFTEIRDKLEVDYSAPSRTDGSNDYYLRDNVKGVSRVAGASLESSLDIAKTLSFTVGGSYIPMAKLPVNKEYVNRTTDRMLRVPEISAFSMLQVFYLDLTGTLSAQYLGVQNIAHTVSETEIRLEETEGHAVFGARIAYKYKSGDFNYSEFFAGIDNITDSYQKDLDKGDTRDAGYIYGPIKPRTFYLGMKAGF